jgi:hypothetical protein
MLAEKTLIKVIATDTIMLLINALPKGNMVNNFEYDPKLIFFGIHSIGIAVNAPLSFKEVVIIQNNGKIIKIERKIIIT